MGPLFIENIDERVMEVGDFDVSIGTFKGSTELASNCMDIESQSTFALPDSLN